MAALTPQTSLCSCGLSALDTDALLTHSILVRSPSHVAGGGFKLFVPLLILCVTAADTHPWSCIGVLPAPPAPCTLCKSEPLGWVPT